MGPELPRQLGLTKDEFLALSAAEQIQDYGKWLAYYRYPQQIARYGMNLAGQPLARQAAVLQAMQFAPNGSKWKKGDYSVPSTNSQWRGSWATRPSMTWRPIMGPSSSSTRRPTYAGNLGPVIAPTPLQEVLADLDLQPDQAAAAAAASADKQNIAEHRCRPARRGPQA